MKKILFLFVFAFGLMSFSSANDSKANVSENQNQQVEILTQDEVSLVYLDEIDCWRCTITVFFPDFTTTTITGESCISPAMACAYARHELSKRLEANP